MISARMADQPYSVHVAVEGSNVDVELPVATPGEQWSQTLSISDNIRISLSLNFPAFSPEVESFTVKLTIEIVDNSASAQRYCCTFCRRPSGYMVCDELLPESV